MGDSYTNVKGVHLGVINGVLHTVGLTLDVHNGQANVQATASSEIDATSVDGLVSAANISTLAFANAIEARWGSTFRSAIGPVMSDVQIAVLGLPPTP